MFFLTAILPSRPCQANNSLGISLETLGPPRLKSIICGRTASITNTDKPNWRLKILLSGTIAVAAPLKERQCEPDKMAQQVSVLAMRSSIPGACMVGEDQLLQVVL